MEPVSAKNFPNSFLTAVNETAEWFAHLAASSWDEPASVETVKELAAFIDKPAPALLASWSIEKAAAPSSPHKPRLTLLVPDPDGKHPTPDAARTRCYMVCGEVPFAGFHCLMICVTCTTEWGGGCRVSVYF